MEDNPAILKVLEALKQASLELQAHPPHNSTHSNSSAIKTLLELETDSNSIFSTDPHLSTLSRHLVDLKTLIETLENTRGHGVRSFLTRRVSTHSISRLAGSIESEIQTLMDRESIECLIKRLKEPCKNEDELVQLLTQFEDRVSGGFNRELQNSILESKAFPVLQTVLCDPNRSKRVRENAAFCIAALIRFNKDVFVGQVDMRSTIQALLEMKSTHSIKILCEIITFIKSPFVDEIHCNGKITEILSLLQTKDLDMKVLAFDCVLEICYFGRKEAVEAMIEGGLIEKLVDSSRRSEFASCVARFAVQLEIGEGLRRREKRAFKQEILEKVKEAAVDDAEAATIIAEVLWGSSP